MTYMINCNRCGTLTENDAGSAPYAGYSSLLVTPPTTEFDDPWTRKTFHLCGECAKELSEWLTANA